MELIGWVRIHTDAYEEDFDELGKAWVKIQAEHERVRYLHGNVTFKADTVMMAKSLNHTHQADPYIEFFHFIGKVAPASYGLFYFRDSEGASGRDHNRFYVLRMVRGQVEELEDTLLSPCVPLIEDPEPA